MKIELSDSENQCDILREKLESQVSNLLEIQSEAWSQVQEYNPDKQGPPETLKLNEYKQT